MSAADDVLEMKSIANELADRLVGKVKLTARVGAVAGAVGVGENRAKEFLKGIARRIDAWEKENGKRQRDALRRREQLEQENQHLAWLECEIARHRASGEELRGPHIDALVNALRAARGETGAVALSETTDEL